MVSTFLRRCQVAHFAICFWLCALPLQCRVAIGQTTTTTATSDHQHKPKEEHSILHNKATECIPINEELNEFQCLERNFLKPSKLPCIDANDQCSNWASTGECSKNPQYMQVNCRKSCGTCLGLHHGGVIQAAPNAKTRNMVLERLVETEEYQHGLAEKSVESLKTCINRHELCTHWSLESECETNPQYMNRECRAACRMC